MSVDHKAWLFDFSRFQAEAASALFAALQGGSIAPLQTAGLISSDFDDVQSAGEAAIATYIAINDDYSLSYWFDALRSTLRLIPSLAACANEAICGLPFGPAGNRFDPGLMGTGFVSVESAHRLSCLLSDVPALTPPPPDSPIYSECLYKPHHEDEIRNAFATLKAGYKAAQTRGWGLMIVDFLG